MISDPIVDSNALELRLAGASYEKIATNLGLADGAEAQTAVRRALSGAGQPAELSDDGRLELAQLDALMTGLWGAARRGDVQAVDRVLRIAERRSVIVARVEAAKTEEGTTVVDDLAARRRTGTEDSGAAPSRRRSRGS